MNKFLTSAAAVALLAGAAAARADDSATVNGITFYGVVDVGITYDTHGAPENTYGSVNDAHVIQSYNNKATWNLSNSNLSQSRLGIKGAEDLGDGWTGLFKLETGINPSGGNIVDGLKTITMNNGVAAASRSSLADSSQAGEAFNRAAYVGVSNDKYGTLTAGRQNTLQTDLIGTYDPLYNGYGFALIGFSGTASGSGSTEDARWDNSVKYLYSYGPFRAGAQYQFGGTISRNDTGEAFDIGADFAGLSIDGVYVHKKDEISASVLSAAQVLTASAAGFDITKTVAATAFDADSYSLAARYTLDQFKFFAGLEYIVSKNPSSPIFQGNIDIGGYQIYAPNNTAFTHNREQTIAWVGARYQMTSKFEIDAAGYMLHQNSYATGVNTGCNDTRNGSCSGDQYVVSLLTDYHFSKKFDMYAGVMYSDALNGLGSGFLHNNNISPSVGMRYSF
ncbi:MAG TPA: porin [Magnetospirillaceae bacterium]|nr:porin [Magnetospirillaceae bacterium]